LSIWKRKADGEVEEEGFISVKPQKDREAIRRTRLRAASLHSD